ncbi:MAG: hypothetical protein AAGA28_00255 [Pseudomonadota bacterium]
MQSLTLTKTRLFEGVWEGILTGDPGLRPDVTVTHLQDSVPDVEVFDAEQPGEWVLRIPVPPDRIADGVQTFVISETGTGEALGSFSLIAGDALGDDIRAEVSLLREELDMLKRAFRRHCLETM